MSSFGTPTRLNANIVICSNQRFGASLTPTTKGNGTGFNNEPGFKFGASMTPTNKGNGSGFQFHALPTTPATGQGSRCGEESSAVGGGVRGKGR